MQTVTVKHGKPIIHLPFHILRLIGLLACFLNLISIIYILELFSVAVHVKNKYGQYMELVKDGPSNLSMLISFAGLIALVFNTFTIFTIYKVFNSTRKLFVLFLKICFISSLCLIGVLFVLITVGLALGNPPEPSKIQNLLNALANYSADSQVKTKIDKMQVEFQCCGARNYTDWYAIEWYDKNFVRKTDITVVGETPFSCCSFHSNFPCVHHGIEKGAGAYKYTADANFSLSATGCYDSLQNGKLKKIWEIIGYIFGLILIQAILFIPTRLIQTATIERGKLIADYHVYTCWIIGCHQGSKKDEVDDDVPPVPPFISE